jgi:NAD(P)-dependent dehydrogenase (short-subunit alcohol dehydrogenase family)
MLAKVAATELAEHGILVNAILPGPTMTPMAHDDSRPDLAERMLRDLPVKRFCEPEEVARAILFLLESDWMTGANMAFDGGLQVSGPIDFWDLVSSSFPDVASLRPPGR